MRTHALVSPSAAVKCTGELVASQGSGQRVEMKVASVEVLGDSDATKYPIQPKKYSLEFLRENAHLRFRTNTYSAIFRMRHQVSFGIHEYFDREGYNYFHSPIITASDAEGAGEMFRVSVLDPKLPPLNDAGEVNFKEDFFGAESRTDGLLQLIPKTTCISNLPGNDPYNNSFALLRPRINPLITNTTLHTPNNKVTGFKVRVFISSEIAWVEHITASAISKLLPFTADHLLRALITSFTALNT